jgi:RND family efflux transporter MFP subunit
MKTWIPWTLAAAWTWGCGSSEPGRIEAPVGAASVVVSELETGSATLAFPAEVVAEERVELATRASGIVRRVTVDVGSRVRAGQLLVALESGDVGAGIAAARAGATQARRYLDRIVALEADGAATPQELDDARARLAMAQAEVQRAEAQFGYVNLSAPFAGVVTERRVDPGDLVVPGQPALTLVSTGGLVVRADLPGERASQVAEGDPVTIVLPDGARVPARVTRVVPALEGASRRFRVEVALEAPPAAAGLMPGMFARLEMEGGGEETRWMPADAVVRRGQLTGVFVVERDTLRLRWVRLGESRGDAVEVLAGPAGDVRLVRRPAPQLADGQPARVGSSQDWRLEAPADGDPERTR